jgi:hypothetical protein
MAKRNMQPLANGAIVLQDGKFKWTITPLELLALVSTGVTGSGIVLANVQQRFSLMMPTFTEGPDGELKPAGELPVNHTISVRITRDAVPGNQTEIDAVAKAAAESKLKQTERTQTETETRQRAVKAAVEMTLSNVKEGMTLATVNRPSVDVVSTVKTAVELSKVLKELAS